TRSLIAHGADYAAATGIPVGAWVLIYQVPQRLRGRAGRASRFRDQCIANRKRTGIAVGPVPAISAGSCRGVAWNGYVHRNKACLDCRGPWKTDRIGDLEAQVLGGGIAGSQRVVVLGVIMSIERAGSTRRISARTVDEWLAWIINAISIRVGELFG